MTHRQHTLHFQCHQRLTQRRAADTELGGQIALGRHAIPWCHLVVGDIGAELLDDDFIQPWPGDRPELLYH